MLLLMAVAAAAATYFLTSRMPSRAATPPPMPIRVVHDRPGGAHSGAGAKISEPEAILRLQRTLDLKAECVAIMSKGYSDGAYQLVAVNRCDGTRLGRYRVDGATGSVSR